MPLYDLQIEVILGAFKYVQWRKRGSQGSDTQCQTLCYERHFQLCWRCWDIRLFDFKSSGTSDQDENALCFHSPLTVFSSLTRYWQSCYISAFLPTWPLTVRVQTKLIALSAWRQQTPDRKSLASSAQLLSFVPWNLSFMWQRVVSRSMYGIS